MSAVCDRDALAEQAAGSQGVWDSPRTGRLLRRAYATAAISQWTKDDTLKRCPEAESAEIIYYGASKLPHLETAIEKPKGRYLFCAARMAEYKGLDLLLMAFAALLEDEPDLHLVICGQDYSSGGVQRFVEALALGKNVTVLGQLSHAEVRSWLAGCEFFIMPSRRESLGIAVIEALQAGKAVVATHTGGLPEIVRDGLEGLLVPPKNVSALAGAMRRLAVDKALRQRMGEAGRKRSHAFSWDGAIARYVQMYRSHPSKADVSALIIWDRSTDASAAVYAANARRGFSIQQWPTIVCLRRATWGEGFCVKVEGCEQFRLGLPPSAPSWLDQVVATAQLLFLVARRRRVWHLLLLRYSDLAPLLWFTTLARIKPIVTLS
jgi:hypothetical protein